MAEMNWRQYALAIVLFNLLGFVLLFVILICQGRLPLNPQHFEGMSWDLPLIPRLVLLLILTGKPIAAKIH